MVYGVILGVNSDPNNNMKKAIPILATLFLAGCGSFPLGHVHPQMGKTQEQHQLDTLTCKDQAHMEANTSERQAGSFLAGLTIIGAPIAIEAEKAKQREVFKSCMEKRGYRVTPPGSTTAQARTGCELVKDPSGESRFACPQN